MNILFMGTPEFAVPTLKRLIESRHRVVGLVTQPDRPKGRSKEPIPPATKEVAQAKEIQILQPLDLNDPSFLKRVQSLNAELAVVVAYGRILPLKLLAAFPRGAINLHASLLPKFRGAAPIQWALIRGESQTGVTLFQMDEQADHGPILLGIPHPIRPEDTAVTLSEALAQVGSQAVLDLVDRLKIGSIRAEPQEHSLATDAPLLTKEDGIIDWRLGCQEIHNRVRGLQPWPGATTMLEGKSLKLFATHPDQNRHDSSAPPGTVVAADPVQAWWVQTGQGQLEILRLQPAGGKVLEASAFLRGNPIRSGALLGG